MKSVLKLAALAAATAACLAVSTGPALAFPHGGGGGGGFHGGGGRGFGGGYRGGGFHGGRGYARGYGGWGGRGWGGGYGGYGGYGWYGGGAFLGGLALGTALDPGYYGYDDPYAYDGGACGYVWDPYARTYVPDC